MKYNPAESEFTLLPEGWYDGEVSHAEETLSRAGNVMIRIVIKVFGPGGETSMVWDYIVSSSPYHLRRLKALCEATGVDFDAGEVAAADLIGHGVQVNLGIQRDDTGVWDDKNVVKGYRTEGDEPSDHAPVKPAVRRPAGRPRRSPAKPAPQPVAQDGADDDSIPF